ncbi:glucosamine-6-phosphate isomerase 2 isoform X2 [Salarias fasciatus]|nr:glucosamine-6-phosphate isomerase 2-like isoform X5 [Salarias fasciatus]XP_029972410.1 glucosamine-6-phosphate isomerase 2-like isoform X5 [Salarias fasciatus]XP_029972411.1 glucosamine-6-phosphate isomerase 2-like isoform X5 [Salarias fasciatus]XP_029973229.1 glucosamine-6-phosphate isomerase 2 isoform X2 [Salarias fasciatus]XP_029973230.1 glucosamine-6-phosphate isomerase 2 isoform X2 [Salarias fasciatus]XP_029973231.1 glucosamine-6-phosphate isomerase 2 isoform X2 [Salarias fasciatus]
MRLVILDDYELASEWAAKYIRNRIIQFQPTAERYFTLGLPTGSTPYGCYLKLIEFYRRGELSFKYVKTFNMDEYVGLPRAHPESYHSYMWNNFFKHIDIDPANAHILDGNAENLEAECEAYEQKIADAGGIQLFVGGQRSDGPHASGGWRALTLLSCRRYRARRTHSLQRARLQSGLQDQGENTGQGHHRGQRSLLWQRPVQGAHHGSDGGSRNCHGCQGGAHKAFALYKAIEEGVNHMWTVSAFQQHPRTIFICDEDATLELRVKTVKYFKGLMHVHNKLVEPLLSIKDL